MRELYSLKWKFSIWKSPKNYEILIELTLKSVFYEKKLLYCIIKIKI